MGKFAGSSAGVIALLALLVHNQVLQPSEAKETPKAAKPASAEQSEAEPKDSKDTEETIEGPWLATRAFFQSKPKALNARLRDALRSPSALDAEAVNLLAELLGKTSGSDWRSHSIVATLPDPLHSRMALALDGEIEAIEHGVQAAGWEFSGQWLPWADHSDPNEPDIKVRRAQRRMQREQGVMPGVLVFRREVQPKSGTFPREVLFVFVVPETLTGGVNGASFNAALHCAGALSPETQIGILGPTFSGSFPSLARRLKNWRSKNINRTVYSGTASNLNYARAFKNDTGLDFQGGILDSHGYQQAVCRALKEFGGSERTALLKEDEGGLQQSFATDNTEVPCYSDSYTFPRDISHLRNAAQEVSAAARNPYAGTNPDVDFSIKDPDNGEDSIPNFADRQTPLTQSAVLSSITDDLNRKHTQAVFISATSTLDTLFLARLVRQNCPNTRVLLEGPDVLFIPAATRAALAGTIFFSSYPMFVDGNTWLNQNPDDTSRTVFGDSSSQGVYNVTQLLLRDLGANFTNLRELGGYNQFKTWNGKGGNYPGMWILTLGRSGFLPIAYYSSNRKEWFKEGPAVSRTMPSTIRRPPISWEFTVGACSIAVLICCAFLLWINFVPNARWPLWLLLTDSFYERLPALLATCVSLSGFIFILAFPGWRGLDDSNFAIRFFRWVYLAAFVAPLASYVTVLSTCYRRHRSSDTKLKPAVDFSGFASLVYYGLTAAVFLLGVGSWYRFCSMHDTSFFFRYRVFELYSGSSPAPPYAVCFLIFFFISLVRFRRYTLAGQGKPLLTMNAQSGYQARLKEAYSSIEQEITAPMTLQLPAWISRFLFSAMVAAGGLLTVGRNPFAFESGGYNWALLFMFSVALFYLGNDLYDFVKLWHCIRKWLELLQLQPLLPALKRIARNWPRCAVWSFSRLTSKQAFERQMLNALEMRMNICEEAEAQHRPTWFRTFAPQALLVPSGAGGEKLAMARKANRTVTQAHDDFEGLRRLLFEDESGDQAEARPTGEQRLRRLRKLHDRNAELASRIYEEELIPEWKHLRKPGGLNDSPDAEFQRLYIESSENFVMLQDTRFIVYVVGHIRSIGSSLSLSFLLLVLLFHSYSPQGPQIIGRFLAVLFVVIACAVWHVFAGMERNAVLSRISRTKPGELGGQFWIHLLAIGGLPLLGVIAHLFPAVSQFLFQWIAPTVQDMH